MLPGLWFLLYFCSKYDNFREDNFFRGNPIFQFNNNNGENIHQLIWPVILIFNNLSRWSSHLDDQDEDEHLAFYENVRDAAVQAV